MTPKIELILKEKAYADMGFHPAAIIKNGVETPRDRYGDGWNDALMELHKKEMLLKEWHKTLSIDIQDTIEALLIADVIEFNIDEMDITKIKLYVNLNDIFTYAADAEEVKLEDLESLLDAWRPFGWNGIWAWFSLKLKIMPIPKRITTQFQIAYDTLKTEDYKPLSRLQKIVKLFT